MSERLPYEDQLQQQWNDLPLPDENMAWADMKRRLEEDDDDGAIVWWRRGCLLWGLLLIALFGAGWWFLRPEKWLTSKTKQEKTIVQKKEDSISRQNNDRTTDLTATDRTDKKINETNDPVTQKKQNDLPVAEQKTDEKITAITSRQTGTIRKKSNRNTNPRSVTPGEEYAISYKKQGIKKGERKPVNKQGADKKNKQANPDLVVTDKPVLITDADSVVKQDVMKSVAKPVTTVDSSITQQKTDSVKEKAVKENIPNQPKKDSTKKKPVSFSAGIALQQLLPVAGQKTVPYNSLGRKGTLADYIPSIYFRVNKGNKWFVQTVGFSSI